jgi:hypothetical protein
MVSNAAKEYPRTQLPIPNPNPHLLARSRDPGLPHRISTYSLTVFSPPCRPDFGEPSLGTGYGSGTASANGAFHNPRRGSVHFLAVALVGCGPQSCSVRLRAPLAAGKCTRLVRVCTAGGTLHSEYLFLSKRFRLHAIYDATVLIASCVLSLNRSRVV